MEREGAEEISRGSTGGMIISAGEIYLRKDVEKGRNRDKIHCLKGYRHIPLFRQLVLRSETLI